MAPESLNHISKKKLSYIINSAFFDYLKKYNRSFDIPVRYKDLLRFDSSISYIDKNGKDTLWQSVSYPPSEMQEICTQLTMMYAMLKTEGDMSVMEHLYVDRIDFCTFGNSKPFRIKIVNHYNDNYDYYYVKLPDSSRVYGLEWEHILSPNRINYLVDKETLVEEHIVGIPGDQFISNNLHDAKMNETRLAKEFVKFNERCLVRLLGDMRAYNYVIDVTDDFEDTQYRIRAIDFDQQSYEGRKGIYLPQYFKENKPYIDLCVKLLNTETVKQYQQEEHALMAKRIKSSRYRVKELLEIMCKDEISTPDKIKSLSEDLAKHYNNKVFLKAKNSGDIMRYSLAMLIDKNDWSFYL